jgi:DNA-binding response OmpR family regulator
MSGLEVGADDYLSKPFDAEELKLIVRNRIEERRKMREHFSKDHFGAKTNSDHLPG